jgi:hypothetical protein
MSLRGDRTLRLWREKRRGEGEKAELRRGGLSWEC